MTLVRILKSTDSQGKKKSADAGATVLNACSASRNAGLTAPFNGKTGGAARSARIDQARSAMDNMIANCGSTGIESDIRWYGFYEWF